MKDCHKYYLRMCVPVSKTQAEGVADQIIPATNIAEAGYKEAVQKVYVVLGGVQETYPLNLRPWDMQFNSVAVELDEEQHFHRYRTQTLASHIYKKLSTFSVLYILLRVRE